MDVMKTVREIGFFETARNMSEVADSETVRSRVEESMPMPGEDFESGIERAAEWLTQFGKRKLMLLSPEIAIIEALAQKGKGGCKVSNGFGHDSKSKGTDELEIILVIPSNMDPESKQRLMNNIPKGIKVELLDDPFFPKEDFIPSNGLIAAFGCSGANRLMALPETYRMIEQYSHFWGKKVFVPYVCCDYPVRMGEWTEVNPARFDGIWEDYRWQVQ